MDSLSWAKVKIRSYQDWEYRKIEAWFCGILSHYLYSKNHLSSYHYWKILLLWLDFNLSLPISEQILSISAFFLPSVSHILSIPGKKSHNLSACLVSAESKSCIIHGYCNSLFKRHVLGLVWLATPVAIGYGLCLDSYHLEWHLLWILTWNLAVNCSWSLKVINYKIKYLNCINFNQPSSLFNPLVKKHICILI